MSLDIKTLQESANIAELLSEEELIHIGSQVVNDLEIDEESRADWKELIDKALDIAKQTMEQKNHPFPNSSNVKYPLITQASIDFASRTFPEIFKFDRIVKAKIIGSDPDGEKYARGQRVSKHMSYQLVHESESWEEGKDRALHILPILGTVFTKVYYDSLKGKPVVDLCTPDKIVVNYNTPSLEEARRVTHILDMHSNDIVERMRAGLYRDIDIEKLKGEEGYDEDSDSLMEVYEQHRYLDLDGDGYKEPYIVIVHAATKKVLRILNRFSKVEKNKKGEIMRIVPKQYFVDYHLIKSPDGGFYSIGLGTLLYPINAAINTLINQLIDAGTLSNTQGGWIAKGIRMKAGDTQFKPGEYKSVETSGMDLAKNILPIPTKEPSATLFALLQMLIEVGKDLVSINDVLQGKQQAQNVPATTILTLVEQGMKVFNAVHKRLYRSLRKEFNKIYEINREHLKDSEYQDILDQEEISAKDDYRATGYDILPVMDPMMASSAQRLAKAQALMSVPGINPYEATKYYLEALQMEESEISRVLPEPDPNAPPPPDVLKTLAETDKIRAETLKEQIEAQIASEENVLKAEELKIKQKQIEAYINEAAARIAKMRQDGVNNAAKTELATQKSDHEAYVKEFDKFHQREKDQAELALKMAELQLKAQEGDDSDR